MTASGGVGGQGVERLSYKEKGLMDMGNSVVISGRRVYKEKKWKKYSSTHTQNKTKHSDNVNTFSLSFPTTINLKMQV